MKFIGAILTAFLMTYSAVVLFWRWLRAKFSHSATVVKESAR